MPHRARRPTPSSPTRWSSISATVAPSLAGPKRPQDRVPLATSKAGFIGAMDERVQARPTTSETRYPGRGREVRPRPRRRGDRRDHLLHQHLQPQRDDRGRAAGAQRGRQGPDVKPWVKTSLAPGSQVVTTISTRPELQKPLDKLGFKLVGYGCTTCIGNSGPLPPAISTTINKHNARRRGGAVGQPQLRGPGQPRRARQLSGLAAAGGRLCAGRLAADRSRPRSRSATTRRASRSILRDIWPTTEEIAGDRRQASSRRRCSRSNTARCSTATRNWRKVEGRRRPDLCLGHAARPMCRTRPISRA